MKALRLMKKMDYQVVDIPEPVQDGKHVIVKVDMLGICGSDLSIWKDGEDGFMGAGKIMGHEFRGTVTDPGPRSDLKVGDTVVCCPTSFCGKCEYCKRGMENICIDPVPNSAPGNASDGACTPYFPILAEKAFKIDPSVDIKAATLVEPLANARHAVVYRGNVQKGDKVLIIGGGIIAIFCAWWAKHQGAEKVVIAEINPARAKHIMDTKAADEVVDLSDEKVFADLKERMGIGFDVGFECSHPNELVLNKLLMPLVRKAGTVVQLGCREGLVPFNTFFYQLKEISYVPSWSMRVEDFTESIKAVEQYGTDFLPHITSVISMEEVQKKVEDLASGKTNDVKVMIDPQR